MTKKNSRKNMLILVGRNPKNMRGGASTWILNIDSYFQKDFQVDYLIVPEWLLNITFVPDRIKAFVQAFFTLLFKSKKWDIVLSHSPELSFIATLFSNNVIHVAHGNINPLRNPTFKWGKVFYSLYEYFNKVVYWKALLLYTVGEKREGYIQINQPINHNVVPLESNNKSGFIFAGRLEAIKNIEKIIEAYSKLPKSIQEENYFYIYGQGTKEIPLKSKINSLGLDSRINLLGHIDNNELITQINHSKILLMASEFEGFPMVIAEALTVGTPILSTDVGSISQVVKNGYNGYTLSKECSPSDYADCIMDILKSHEELSSNALTSSYIFDASEVYNCIKTGIDQKL